MYKLHLIFPSFFSDIEILEGLEPDDYQDARPRSHHVVLWIYVWKFSLDRYKWLGCASCGLFPPATGHGPVCLVCTRWAAEERVQPNKSGGDMG